MNNATPFSRTELLKLIAVIPLTQVSKIAFKAGNTVEDLMGAALEADYTRQGVNLAIRAAGKRTRKERSDKGQTLRLKINKLVDEAKALQEKLAQEGGSSPSDQQPRQTAA
jgi:hypothetical protein